MKVIAFFEEENDVSQYSSELLSGTEIECRYLLHEVDAEDSLQDATFIKTVFYVIKASSIAGCDLALIFSRYGAVYNPGKLEQFLQSDKVEKFLASFCITDIAGIGFRHSPRLPYIDHNFMALNIKAMRQCDFQSYDSFNASHFSSMGGPQAELISWIEHVFENKEFSNYFDIKHSCNQYGEKGKFMPLPMSFHPHIGVAICDPSYDPSLMELLRVNTRQVKLNSKSDDKLEPVVKQRFIFSSLVNRGMHLLGGVVYSDRFHKRYDI